MFFVVAAGLLTAPAVSDGSDPGITAPAAGAELQIGAQAVLEWSNWSLHKGHAVKKKGSATKRFNYEKGRHRDLEGFITACKEHCESGRVDGKNVSCGGFVVNYSRGSNKKKPRYCVFKREGASPYKRNSKDFYEELLMLKNDGRQERGMYLHNRIGYNLRTTDLQAAVGLGQLEKLAKIIGLRLSFKIHLYRTLRKFKNNHDVFKKVF